MTIQLYKPKSTSGSAYSYEKIGDFENPARPNVDDYIFYQNIWYIVTEVILKENKVIAILTSNIPNNKFTSLV